jgi:hypothetical protein
VNSFVYLDIKPKTFAKSFNDQISIFFSFNWRQNIFGGKREKCKFQKRSYNLFSKNKRESFLSSTQLFKKSYIRYKGKIVLLHFAQNLVFVFPFQTSYST